MTLELSLFDVDPESAPVGEPPVQPQAPAMVHPVTRGAAGVDVGWHEVPQPLFNSWSTPRQLAYCAARDQDAADNAHCDVPDADFYRVRAAHYREVLRGT